MEKNFDYVVIGSGPAAVHAAQTLVEGGVSVTMVDVGILPSDNGENIPDTDFVYLRQHEKNQFTYLLGKDFETIPLDNSKVGAQLTPQRKHLVKEIERFIPLESDSFFPMESLAYGGLGAGWGLGCYVYNAEELKKAGLNPHEFNEAYQIVANRIGLSGGTDDVTKYTTAHLEGIQPALPMDNSLKKIYSKYLNKREAFNKRNIFLGSAPMAMLSEDFLDRKKTDFSDMDFYTDRRGSAYRAWMTTEKLKQKPNFTYLGNCLMLQFEEKDHQTSFEILHTDTLEKETIFCKNLILATGPLGNARIVLRSLKDKISRLPVLCNPYAYVPCINLSMLGTPLDRFKTSMAQAVMIYDKGSVPEDIVTVSLFTYRSLMLYKLIKEAPLGYSDGRAIMNYLQSAFVIAGIHHPDLPSDKKYLELRSKKGTVTGDVLFANFSLSENEQDKVKENEKYIRKILRSLGTYPIQRLDPGFGSSIHYAGTLPFSKEEKPGCTSANGRLHGFSNVYVADASAFTYLPAKGITFSLMANACNVAKNCLNQTK